MTEAIIGVNYLGPYISDGKVQESVPFGLSTPTSELDAEARLHDSAYAKYKDYAHRTAADAIFEERVSKMGTTVSNMAGGAVLYGNSAIRSGAGPASEALKALRTGDILNSVAGAVRSAVYSYSDIFDYGTHSAKYQSEVLDFYKTDPHPELQNASVVLKKKYDYLSNSEKAAKDKIYYASSAGLAEIERGKQSYADFLSEEKQRKFDKENPSVKTDFLQNMYSEYKNSSKLQTIPEYDTLGGSSKVYNPYTASNAVADKRLETFRNYQPYKFRFMVGNPRRKKNKVYVM